MIEPTTTGKDTYTLPMKGEAAYSTPAEVYTQEARELAATTPAELDPADIDAHRVEQTVGASAVTAVDTSIAPRAPEIDPWWKDPRTMMQLSRLPVTLRTGALKDPSLPRGAFDRAA